jgi:hypothetical protein
MEKAGMPQVIIVLTKSVIFCCFFTSILFAAEDKAVYCINKEEPETLVLVRNIEQLFVFPDTVIGTESCEMISIFAGVTITEKESILRTYMTIGGRAMAFRSNIRRDSTDKETNSVLLPPKKLSNEQYLGFPKSFQEKQTIRSLFPNQENSFIVPTKWSFTIKCKSGDEFEMVKSADILISGYCTKEELKSYLEEKTKMQNTSNTLNSSNCVEPVHSNEFKEDSSLGR